ncbi:hypothetical protein D3C78_1834730 [compost metagenome]
MPKASNVPTRGSKPGKKILLNTRAEAVAKRNRSYHSTVVPMTLATATFFMSVVCSSCGVATSVYAGLVMPFLPLCAA